MFRVLISSVLLVISFNIWGVEETSPDHSSQYRETARISWKIGILRNWHLQKKNKTAFQFPIIAELQFPVSIPYFKWLLHAGGGLIINTETETVCDPSFVSDPPGSPFDNKFFQRNYEGHFSETTNPDTCFFKDQKVYRQFTPFFVTQTGFKYGSDVYGVFQGGIMLSTKGDVGWVGELLIGKKLGLDISGGMRMTSFNDSLYVGLVFYLGNAIKSWWVEQSIE